jgi:hypothetical protein
MSFFETLTESNDIMALEESVRILNERNVVKMDKQTLKKRLLTQATLLAAKEANDPVFQKYVKASKAKRAYRKQIQQKYESKGRQKVREYLKAHKMLDKHD